ncbi:class I SAM-dependent methyltransferase [Puia sp. P3]|uniref:class I SAM-dependent methyltransferase n=1 Tax=Puia sp. P3 TaxID=3423952 RepID=UPI003D66CD27
MENRRSLKQIVGTYIIPKLPMSRETFEKVRYELNAVYVSINNSINPYYIARLNRHRNKNNLSVNVGAGPFGQEGWTNIDMFKFKNISFPYDCRKKLPFRDNTVDRIRAEHVFEHLDKKEEAPKFLSECLRCLKPDGTLRIVVPDLELFINAYKTGTAEAWKSLGFDIDNLPGGLVTPMDILNYTFRQNGEHKYAYDFATLRYTVMNAGFKDVTKVSFGVSADPMLRADQEVHRNYSLYADCTK